MRFRKPILYFLTATFSLALSLLIVEGLLRAYKPYASFRGASELSWKRNNPHDLARVLTVDPEFGFRPILGNGSYNEYGTLVNEYRLEKRPDIKRLLFIGDSVTHRGRIVVALERLFGEDKFEYWNAGVESFNTVQEVKFYKKYNRAINPDHVILTFHLNDFETTPIAFFDRGALVVYSPNTSLENVSVPLFRYSYTYRILLGLMVARSDKSRESIIREVEKSLEDLRTILEANAIDLTVVVFPYLKRYEDWDPEERHNRHRIINILKKLGLKHFDLFETSNKAIKAGVDVEERKGDFWHPSEEAAVLFAKYLHEEALFE